jgi:Domain of unknown function (DUF4365)
MSPPAPNSGTYTTIHQEEFSYAFIGAIATAAGYAVKLAGRTEDAAGKDLAIVAPSVTGKSYTSPVLDAQVKCTINDSIIKETHVHYPLAIKNYNYLIDKPLVPRLLIIVIIPRNLAEWLDASESQTILQKCVYWISLKGQLPKKNAKKVTIRIPRSNLLTPQSLKGIMQRIADEEDL